MTLFRSEKEKLLFHNIITKKEGVLEEESNYFWVDDNLLSDNGKACTLRNTRVILYWRGINLEDFVVKRILTLGFDFLIMGFTKDELLAKVLQTLPPGTFEIKIKFDRKVYVLITIEEPIFRF
jgi:hypothetical protein